MPLTEKTKKEATKARRRLSKALPRKKKTVFSRGYLGKAVRQLRGAKEKRKKMMEELGL
jgi:hypothetical protein